MSKIACQNCQDAQSSDWTQTLADSGTYTYCPNCKVLSWTFPSALSPYYQEGFRCEISTDIEFEDEPLSKMLEEITKRLDEIGYRFDFDLADWIDLEADRAEQLKTIEGAVVGTAQLEMTSWLFDPEGEGKDEDSDGYLSPETLTDPKNLQLIVETGIADMFNNRGGDGYYFERHQIQDALQSLTYGGQPVEVVVEAGEWTGKG